MTVAIVSCSICGAAILHDDPGAEGNVSRHLAWHIEREVSAEGDRSPADGWEEPEPETPFTVDQSDSAIVATLRGVAALVDDDEPLADDFEAVMAAAGETIEHLKEHPLPPDPSGAHRWDGPVDGLRYCAVCGYAEAAGLSVCSGVYGERLAKAVLDPEPDTPAVARPAQVPEDAWAELNAEQRADVANRVDRIAARQQTIDEARHPADVATAQKYLDESLATLTEDYGFALLEAEAIEQADADLSGPVPRRVTASSHARHFTADELSARRRFLLAKHGLPVEMEEDRQAELAEIDRRLRAEA